LANFVGGTIHIKKTPTFPAGVTIFHLKKSLPFVLRTADFRSLQREHPLLERNNLILAYTLDIDIESYSFILNRFSPTLYIPAIALHLYASHTLMVKN
jgi:hypothetical protein